MTRQSANNKLNAKQLRTLGLIYRFRFITIPLLAQYKHIKHQTVLEAINILEKQKFIGKRHSKDYKLLRKAARYYLATEGLKEFKKQGYGDELILHAMYKNPSMHEASVDRYLQAMELYIKLEKDYPGKFEIYTKVETTHVDGFIEPTPDLFIRHFDRSKSSYFLELQSGNPLFVLKKLIQAYIEHFESGEWSQEDYPILLLVCDTPEAERAVQEYVAKVLESTGIDDEMLFLTTTYKALLSGVKEVWTNPLTPELIVHL